MGDRLRDEQELPTDLDLLLLYRQFSTQDLNETFEFLRNGLNGIPGLLSLRVKRLDSIVRKLRRQPTMDIVRMDDIVGYRFIVASMTDLQASVEALTANCSPHRVRDYRIEFHNGYRAVHMIFRRELQLPGSDGPKWYSYEVQLRTYFQHLWSSTSESFGEQVKEGGGSPQVRDYLDILSNQIQQIEEDTPDRQQMPFALQNSGLALYALEFDHHTRTLIDVPTSFGSNIGMALQYFNYLESRARDDLSREIVLLGCSSSLEELQVTHLRYFQPQGIPDLPEELRPEALRPGGLSRLIGSPGAWVHQCVRR